MKYIYKMESVLISVAAILCTVLLIKLLYKLRSNLPWRVNCWFCNNYFWIKYPDRNSWTCRICEQYNGFTKDGDYNKPITAFTEQSHQTPKVLHRSPPKNGLCKMCNINQQLKVTQLANFVPMSEKTYDNEIESYRLQLEKAYKLCSPCKKVLQVKLYKEKETFLGSKLLASRTPEKKMNKKQQTKSKMLKKFINNTSMLVAVILFILVSFEFYTHLIIRYQNLLSTMTYIREIMLGLLERVYSIIEMKTSITFPMFKHYFYDIYELELMPKSFNLRYLDIDQWNLTIQKALGSFVCLLQTVGLIWNVNKLKSTIIIDLHWLVFVVATLGLPLDQIYLSFTKVICTFGVIMVYKLIKPDADTNIMKVPSSPKRMKNLVKSVSTVSADEETTTLDTDDDVSLSKFGIHNLSESSNETVNALTASLISGRTFTPRSDLLWSKPKLNSTFCVNSVLAKSPSSVSDTVFVKPVFKDYQKLAKDESDSDLDDSISTLCIGSSTKSKKKANSIFSLKKFTATPNFVTPIPLTRSRPLISPSTLGHSTSWVAGGYWGSEGPLFNLDGSRSSSQSSGFESQASSLNHRNVFSQPPSREESVCGEPMVLDRNPPTTNVNTVQSPQNFSHGHVPVFPQMQYNGHVHIPQQMQYNGHVHIPQQMQYNGHGHIPQPKAAQPYSVASTPVFSSQQSYTQSSIFKTPNGPSLIKLPPVNLFLPR